MPGADHSIQGPSIRSRLGKTNLETREAQQKTRKARALASSRQSHPREAKSKEFLAALCGQKVEDNSTDSEEEDRESSKSS